MPQSPDRPLGGARRKLWAEGHSASQIAKELGGVTRNAVIGKVH
ncbi:MAG: GcrA family cell cycle regulator, partial [Myxococcota bacterium]